MKTLEIQVPEGHEIDKEKSTFEKIVFKPIENNYPKSWKELGHIRGHYVTPDSRASNELEPMAVNANRNVFPKKEQAEAVIALAQLLQLRERYVNGWEPDWDDEDKTKWAIFYYENSLTVRGHYSSHRVMSFATNEIAEDFLSNHRDLLKIAKPLL